MLPHLRSKRLLSQQAGFTLIEVLVVLTITSLVTTLLVAGLNTTWGNFNKLNNSQLIFKSSRIPLFWFSESVEGATLLHPFKSYFSGTATEMSFITMYAPNTQENNAVSITWRVKNKKLQLIAGEPNIFEGDVFTFYDEVSFRYLTQSGWKNTFSSNKAELPLAIQIIDGDQKTLLTTSPKRPHYQEVPADIKLNGELVL